MPNPSKTLTKGRLQKVLDLIPALKQQRRGSVKFEKWQRDTEVAISHAFGESSDHVRKFKDIHYVTGFVVGRTSDSDFQQMYISGLESADALLQSLIDEVEEYWEEDREPLSPDSSESRQSNRNQVFIIHGRDYGTRNAVTGFLKDLGLEPVVLQEQASQGLTVIENFERWAGVDFAIALLTPDDLGGSQDDSLQPRARQNAVFELGYFMGEYGRDRVCALVRGAPEIPSDYSGVVYITFDESECWKIGLLKELRSAGFDIDANRVFG